MLDGGLATTLQQRAGLPRHTPVEPWLFERPDAVRAAQAAFVEAGSDVLLTATFLAATRPDWRIVVERAVHLARAAGPSEVWLALGPVDTEATAARLVEHAMQTAPIDGVVLETVTVGTVAEIDAGLSRLEACRAVFEGPLVLSVVPGEPGAARNGRPLGEVAREAMRRGASGFGVNCVSGPIAIRAVDSIAADIPVWVKPSGDLEGPLAFAHLWSRARWIGGCCGTTPGDLRAWLASR